MVKDKSLQLIITNRIVVIILVIFFNYSCGSKSINLGMDEKESPPNYPGDPDENNKYQPLSDSEEDDLPPYDENDEDPNKLAEQFLKIKALEDRFIRRVEELARRDGLYGAQINLIKSKLSKLKEMKGKGKIDINQAEKDLNDALDVIVKWEKNTTDNIKCKKCKINIKVDRSQLLYINDNVWGSGSWTVFNGEQGTSSYRELGVYPSLREAITAHQARTHYSYNCPSCFYREKIETAKSDAYRVESEYNQAKKEYNIEAEKANDNYKHLKEKRKKLNKVKEKLDKCKEKVDALEQADRLFRDSRVNDNECHVQ